MEGPTADPATPLIVSAFPLTAASPVTRARQSPGAKGRRAWTPSTAPNALNEREGTLMESVAVS